MNIALQATLKKVDAQLTQEGCQTHLIPETPLEQVIEAIRLLRSEQLAEVWKFIEFLDYKDFLENSSEDEWAWRIVQANEKYKELHPDEPLEVFTSGEDFLKASADW